MHNTNMMGPEFGVGAGGARLGFQSGLERSANRATYNGETRSSDATASATAKAEHVINVGDFGGDGKKNEGLD